MEWICVTDRLPEHDDVEVAVLSKGKYPDCATLNRPVGYKPYWLTPDSCELMCVTHWCELPPAPEWTFSDEESRRIAEAAVLK